MSSVERLSLSQTVLYRRFYCTLLCLVIVFCLLILSCYFGISFAFVIIVVNSIILCICLTLLTDLRTAAIEPYNNVFNIPIYFVNVNHTDGNIETRRKI